MTEFYDTASYYGAYDVISTGIPDSSRTPLYPLIIGLSRDIFGPEISLAVVYFFQGLLFLLSIKWMGVMLENITNNKRVSYWFTAVYALYPGMLSYCAVIMTESFSISLVTAVLYLVSEAYYNNSYKKAALSGILCLLLWMLRPSLTIVPLLLAILWVVLILFDRKRMLITATWGLTFTIISLGCLGLYSLAFKNTYNEIGFSVIPTINNYMALRETGVIDLETIESQEIKTAVDSFLTYNGKKGSIKVRAQRDRWWDESAYLRDNFSLSEYSKFVNGQLKSHQIEIFLLLYNDRLDNLLNNNCVDLGFAMSPYVSVFTRIFPVNNGAAIIISLIGFIVLFLKDMKYRRFSYFVWFLYSLFIANYFSILVGAPNDFTRLLASNYPVLLAVTCWLLNQLAPIIVSGKSSKEKDRE